MARRDSTDEPSFRDALPNTDAFGARRSALFFNTDGFVGPKGIPGLHRGLQNQLDDVMLVQFFLKVAAGGRIFRPPAGPGMTVDGKFGEITRKWIEQYQVHLAKRNVNIVGDGTIDAVINGNSRTPRGFVSTMAMLNIEAGLVLGDQKWDHWWEPLDTPRPLRQKVASGADEF